LTDASTCNRGKIRCCNIGAFLASKRDGNFSMGSTRFFSKLTFYVNKTFKNWKNISRNDLKCLKITICWWGIILTQYGLSFHKQPPPVRDHLSLAFWVVASGRSDCICFVFLFVFNLFVYVTTDMIKYNPEPKHQNQEKGNTTTGRRGRGTLRS